MVGIIFAEGPSGGEAAAWTSVIMTITNMGFSALVAWYLLTKALPKMQDKFTTALDNKEIVNTTALKEAQTLYAAAIDKNQDQFDKREAERRADDKEALRLIVAHCEKESQQRDDTLKVELSLVRTALEENVQTLDELRDVIRDVGSKKKTT